MCHARATMSKTRNQFKKSTSCCPETYVQGFLSGIPAALANPGTDPWAWAVLVWLGLINTALVLFLETNALESVSAAGESLGARRSKCFLGFLQGIEWQKRGSARAVVQQVGTVVGFGGRSCNLHLVAAAFPVIFCLRLSSVRRQV